MPRFITGSHRSGYGDLANVAGLCLFPALLLHMHMEFARPRAAEERSLEVGVALFISLRLEFLSSRLLLQMYHHIPGFRGLRFSVDPGDSQVAGFEALFVQPVLVHHLAVSILAKRASKVGAASGFLFAFRSRLRRVGHSICRFSLQQIRARNCTAPLSLGFCR